MHITLIAAYDTTVAVLHACKMRLVMMRPSKCKVHVQEGEHTNNYVEVAAPSHDPAVVEMRERLLSENGQLTDSEREKLQAHFRV